ncbi:TonB family protein [Sphingomonas canadensis]|uniref:TonB family protein n=1 Tax=Sphingomonas canadensis TaxID=1219257 RepID=A0ABW3H7C6_9SPHN|nr:energy transducer TonB [Sphingomonas canadensis]MCW3834768.1 TonB family protein [Sphingomonas canadensis]
MYADRPAYHANAASRPVSLGASLLISGGIVAALIFVSPDMVKKLPATVLKTYNVREVPPPDPVPVEDKQLPDKVIESRVYTPPVEVKTAADPTPATATSDRPIEAAPIVSGTADTGATRPIETPPPVLPLMPAQQDPRFARDFQPKYPPSEIRGQREGSVTVRVRIGTDGRVKEVRQVSATNDAFFEATRLQAIEKWRFKPATRGGVAEESWRNMSVRFRLKDL